MSLQQRISEKRKELDSLNQIKQLSENLATQLEQLEAKLDTLSEGSQCKYTIKCFIGAWTNSHSAVAIVLSNWNNIIKSASLASSKFCVTIFQGT